MPDIEHFSDDGAQPAQMIQRVMASGLPLATGLRAYAEECPFQVQQNMLRLAQSVESGTPIGSAVQQLGLNLPCYLRGLIDGGLRSNCLGPMLEEYLHQRRAQRRVGQKVAIDLAYPLIVIYFAALICFSILVWLVPMFSSIFSGFAVELPWMTTMLFHLSDLFVLLEYPIIVGFVVVGIALLLFLFGGRWSIVLIDRIPYFGASARYASMSEFCSLLAPLVEASVPLPEALLAVASTMQPSRLKSKTKSLASHYDGSRGLADVARTKNLPHEIVHLLSWEQRGAAFGEILRSWAELFARMADGRSSVISAILAPLLMVGVGLMVGMIVIALFMPLIKLLNQLS